MNCAVERPPHFACLTTQSPTHPFTIKPATTQSLDPPLKANRRQSHFCPHHEPRLRPATHPPHRHPPRPRSRWPRPRRQTNRHPLRKILHHGLRRPSPRHPHNQRLLRHLHPRIRPHRHLHPRPARRDRQPRPPHRLPHPPRHCSGNGIHIITSDSRHPTTPTIPTPTTPSPGTPPRQLRSPRASPSPNQIGVALIRSKLPVLVTRASIRPLDNLTCPAIAIEIAPLNKTMTPPPSPTPPTSSGSPRPSPLDSPPGAAAN